MVVVLVTMVIDEALLSIFGSDTHVRQAEFKQELRLLLCHSDPPILFQWL